MRIAAIISEFNPFHNGHQRIMDYAKSVLRADRLVIIMSGDFTQRGTPAVLDKFDRARCSVLSGADLVIELPVIAAVSCAETFAKTAVSILASTGIVTDILFGAESSDIRPFLSAAEALKDESPVFSDAVREEMKNGSTYPAAMMKALKDTSGISLPEPGPNSTLGLMYAKAVLESDFPLRLHCAKRTGDGHAIRALSSDGFSSSLSIRHALKENNIASALSSMPDFSGSILEERFYRHETVTEDDLSVILHEKLYEYDDFTVFSDISPDLSNRIISLRDSFTAFEAFAAELKTKNITFARAERALIHIILGIGEAEEEALENAGYSPYIRVLAAKQGADDLLGLLSEKALSPVICNLSDAERLLQEGRSKEQGKAALSCLKKDIFASDLFRVLLTKKTGRPFTREISRRFEKV